MNHALYAPKSIFCFAGSNPAPDAGPKEGENILTLEEFSAILKAWEAERDYANVIYQRLYPKMKDEHIQTYNKQFGMNLAMALGIRQQCITSKGKNPLEGMVQYFDKKTWQTTNAFYDIPYLSGTACPENISPMNKAKTLLLLLSMARHLKTYMPEIEAAFKSGNPSPDINMYRQTLLDYLKISRKVCAEILLFSPDRIERLHNIIRDDQPFEFKGYKTAFHGSKLTDAQNDQLKLRPLPPAPPPPRYVRY